MDMPNSAETTEILRAVANGTLTPEQASEKLTTPRWPEHFYNEIAHQESSEQVADDDQPVSIVNQLGTIAAQLGSLANQTFRSFVQSPNSMSACDDQLPVQTPKRAQFTAAPLRVVLRSLARRVRVIADPKVATVVASGPHKLHSKGEVLEIISEGDFKPKLDVFSMRALKFDEFSLGGKELIIRINPDLVLDAEITGGRLITEGVKNLGRVRISVASAQLYGVQQVSEALIQACSVKIEGSFKVGKSRLSVESGNLDIHLSPDADVTVHAESQLGRIIWPGQNNLALDEYVAGNGTARLDVQVVMGRAAIKAD